MDWLLPGIHFNVNTMAAALSVLTSMITPALLISATGTYILSTSNRLARVVDRMRALQEKIETDVRAEDQLPLHQERIHLWETQLGRQIERLRLLQSALTLLYTAAAMFICTSVIIGVLWASRAIVLLVPGGDGPGRRRPPVRGLHSAGTGDAEGGAKCRGRGVAGDQDDAAP